MDERAKRRPHSSYSEARCHPVTLADGQPWMIPRPSWRLTPRFEDRKVVEVGKRFGYRRDVDALVEALAHADDDAVVISLVATIAAELLGEVYDLTPAELDSLLCIDPARPDPMKWVRDVTDVITYQESTLSPEHCNV